MKTITLKEAQALYDVLAESQATQEPILVERDGQPIGVLLPMAEYEAFKAWRETQRLQPARDEAFRREAEAFERMKPELLRQYPGRVVAIRNGQVIEVGGENESVSDVAMRLYERMGYVPIYVQRVEENPHVYKISSPRITRR